MGFEVMRNKGSEGLEGEEPPRASRLSAVAVVTADDDLAAAGALWALGGFFNWVCAE